MTRPLSLKRLLFLGIAVGALGAASFALLPEHGAKADPAAASASAPPPPPVAVATVEPRQTQLYDEFSGRLEAVERVEVRSRVAGQVKSVHFREGALVKAGDLLVTIDPEPFQAEVDQAAAQVASAEARVELAKNELERGERLINSRTISQQNIDERVNAERAARAAQRAAEAQLRAAQLNLSYTQVRAPVSGRVGRLEITVGNLVAAGPGAPMLTSLVSVDPIYASFSADEGVVLKALDALGGADGGIERIPVLMNVGEGRPVEGRMQLIDNQVDPRTGTVRVRAQFANADGRFIPGQFVRLKMGQVKTEPALLVSERAVGTDQDKKFVFVVGADNKAVWREVTLGPAADGLRVVTAGLKPGERVVVNGLHRVRPGAEVTPEPVPMRVTQAAAATATVK
jgi:multidrug efflux system membrane fusion protein